MKYTCEYCDTEYWWHEESPDCPRCGLERDSEEPCPTCVRVEQEDDGDVD